MLSLVDPFMLNITYIRAYSDNYIWLLQQDASPQVVIVDPGQAEQVIAHLEKNKLQLIAILITHQHYDHTGGVAELLAKYPNISIIGPDKDPSINKLAIDLPIAQLFTQTIQDGSSVNIPELNIHFNVRAIPGHTLDHVAYIGEGVVFCGDTLFGAGCGRIFSGTPQMFSQSLSILAMLPEEMKVYCAHEYTLDNLGFSKWIEANNEHILQRDKLAIESMELGISTVPSTIGLELKTNPFLRLHERTHQGLAARQVS